MTTPEEWETLARGYAWGHADASNGGTSDTVEGIQFGMAYREHRFSGASLLLSVQTAYQSWKKTGKIQLI
jgi:hypothetical protein